MTKDKDRFKGEYRVKSDRLHDWDYAGSGCYFVTICTKNKKPFFGEIIDDEMCLSPIGEIIDEEWKRTESLRPNVSLDEYVIMPNHFHAIIRIHEIHLPKTESVETLRAMSLHGMPEGDHSSARMSAISPKAGSLGTIIRAFKSSVTRKAKLRGRLNFAWQRGFYDHIIRDEEDLHRIRRYILDNPLKWSFDPYHPEG